LTYYRVCFHISGLTTKFVILLAELVFLSSNNLSGPLPGAKLSAQANPKKLRGLYLSDNHFTGIIPKQLCSFKSLQALFLDGNDQLAESIPPCLSQFVNLSIAN